MTAPPFKKKLVTRDAQIGSPNSTPSDLEALHQEDDDVIVLTKSSLHEILGTIDARRVAFSKTFPQLVADCDYQTRLAIVAWVFEQLVTHAREGGTFRYLIYERLGFGQDAYLPLDLAGGITISNKLKP